MIFRHLLRHSRVSVGLTILPGLYPAAEFLRKERRLFRVVMDNTVVIVAKPFAALVGRSGNGRTPGTAADNFRFKMVDRYIDRHLTFVLRNPSPPQRGARCRRHTTAALRW